MQGLRPTATISLSNASSCSPASSLYSTCTESLADLAAVTVVPRRTSSPWRPNSRRASLARRRSKPGRKSGSASSTTTSAPSRAHTLPSSSPITPAPITPSRDGTSEKAKAPVESTMRSPSTGAGGMSMGTEPGASTTCRACNVRPSPAWGEKATRFSVSSCPCPASASTPLPANSVPMPPVSCATTASLRAIMRGTSTATLPTSMPSSPNLPFASAYLCEASRRALEGMQPQFRQVPPRVGLPSAPRALSMQAVFMPSCAPRMAAAYPAGPAPMTIRS